MMLDAYRWQNRLLIVLAPHPVARLVIAQRAALNHVQRELWDRDVIWIEVPGDVVTIDHELQSGISAADMRRRYGVAQADARVLLVGKDGGVKLRQAEPIHSDDLFSTIDAMPMRRHEMKERP